MQLQLSRIVLPDENILSSLDELLSFVGAYWQIELRLVMRKTSNNAFGIAMAGCSSTSDIMT